MTASPFPGIFAGLPVVVYPPPEPPDDPGAVAWWITPDGNGRLPDLSGKRWAGEVIAVVVSGGLSGPLWKHLVATVEGLPALRALAVGEEEFGEPVPGRLAPRRPDRPAARRSRAGGAAAAGRGGESRADPASARRPAEPRGTDRCVPGRLHPGGGRV